MRMTVSLVLVSALAACGVDTASDDEETTDLSAEAAVKFNPATDLTEPAWVNGELCTQIFPGAKTAQTQTFVFWAIGTQGIVNAPYNTPQRPNLYAVFGTGAPAAESHHIDSHPEVDHYHIAENDHPGNRPKVKNDKWDVLALFPGPNFNPATYVTAKSPQEMFAQSAAGILTPVMTLSQAGFPDLVLFTPIQCPNGN
jgi:hypothetical protein